ncbi:YbaN family protein [Gemmobacter sp.]|uniref:YbaN family protein n=1 Tax=Gemmobacter sp. TaxID=1898957 RepID=UPI002AFF6135|nr:YbaN family protein [Gemmobacter sp.]
MRVVWILSGGIALALGLAGIVLPLLPTTPFVLLAAFCFARSSPRLHGWLLGHRTFGPIIRNWAEHRAIPRAAKRVSILAMLAALGLSLALGLRWEVLAVQAVVLVVMGTFILTRPDGPAGSA